jgi:hypothetical protein
MEFRRALEIPTFHKQINIKDQLMLCGSCFTENLGEKLAKMLFHVEMNPNGILFNPKSIYQSILSYIENKQYALDDIFIHDDIYFSWQHHSRFSGMNPSVLINQINDTQNEAHRYLRNADWLLLTLGSAFVYELPNGEVVANCHKMPANYFTKRLVPTEEIVSDFSHLVNSLLVFNPLLKIILTISPVRHLRDGYVENNRSKSNLIQAVHQLADLFPDVFYFPAYELVIDDLRDYRFYAEDMTHPNYLATQYVWEKFTLACIDKSSLVWMKEINTINAAMAHKPFQPNSTAHQLFLKKNWEKLNELKSNLPFLHWKPMEDWFVERL